MPTREEVIMLLRYIYTTIENYTGNPITYEKEIYDDMLHTVNNNNYDKWYIFISGFKENKWLVKGHNNYDVINTIAVYLDISDEVYF